METVYQPTIAYEPYQYTETIPVVQEAYEPVQVIEQVARPVVQEYYEQPAQVIEQVARPVSFNSFEPVIPQIRAKVIEEKFNIASVAPVVPVYEQAVVEQPVAAVVETVVQPQVEVIQPVEVVAPVAVQVQPVVEYEAVFFEAPSCGVPNFPSFTAPLSCSGNAGYAPEVGYAGLAGYPTVGYNY